LLKEGSWIGQVLKHLEARDDIKGSILNKLSEGVEPHFIDWCVSG